MSNLPPPPGGTPPPPPPPPGGTPPPMPPPGDPPGWSGAAPGQQWGSTVPPGWGVAPSGYGRPAAELGRRRSAGLVILLTIVTCGIWPIVWSFQNGGELKRWSGEGLGDIGYLFVTLLVSPVTMFMMAGEVEQLYRRDGREPPITTLWGLWFLLPIIGNFIWYLQIQNAINDYWTAHGQTNDPGL